MMPQRRRRGCCCGLRQTPHVVFFLLVAAAGPGAQQVAFDEAVRNLRNPDLSTRLTAVRQLRDSNYPEAAVPVAQLLTDIEDEVQLEAINAELGFFLNRPVDTRKRVGLVVEVRGKNTPQRVFALGPDALAPRAVPPEVPLALVNAAKDRTSAVRLAAVYGFGVLAPGAPEMRRATYEEAATTLTPMIRQDEMAIREAAALVAGRVWKDCGMPIAGAANVAGCRTIGDALIDGMNDRDEGIQLAAMDSLGQLRYGPAVEALTDRFTFYRSGRSAEIALNAIARTGNPASIPLFRTLLADRREGARVLGIEGLARAGDRSALADIQAAASRKPSPAIDLALAFAEQKIGAGSRLDTLTRGLSRKDTSLFARTYLIELGPAAAPALFPFLQDSDPVVRAEVAGVLAAIGGADAVPKIEALLRDPDPRVAQAATIAVARLRASAR
jgi:HEAT repeat protein